jgi:CheY-like chemotaxis protein
MSQDIKGRRRLAQCFDGRALVSPSMFRPSPPGPSERLMAIVLVIDDEPSIRGVCRDILESVGHQVREASNGDQGIRAHRQQAADLVLCDIFMPEKEGLETIQELRRDFPALPVVVMTGAVRRSSHDVLAVALMVGATAALAKPFTTAQLLRIVKTVLRKPDGGSGGQ